ncbi:integral membrane protein TIGR01906 [Arthrobacter subterraneus]|uniref:Integral membrane protein TIGR01906 n=1 Tax=Arthrobacter subterraneus TaxID=335973 RepID=A0A1G8PCU7_9MICC|nr:TIGR01906 family membrane protein [Arthrobacter subterraneus]SDI90138.1 integral membrane protein TIGR01906 [Arthrobacter subterraneus]
MHSRSDSSSERGRNDARSHEPIEAGGPIVSSEPAENEASEAPTDADNQIAAGPGHTAGQRELHGGGTEDPSATGSSLPATQRITAAPAEGSTTADPSSPATHQIAVTPVDSAPASSTGASITSAGAKQSHSTQSRSRRVNKDGDRAPDDVSRRASQRDEAAAAEPVLPRVLQVMIAVFFPVILLAAAVRAVTTPLFLWVEYHRPGFPADSYGFSTEDRMTYGSYTMDYILNWAPARYLGDLVNADGDQLFLDSEVGHMADVKGVLATGFVVATVLALLAVAACIYLARKYPGGIRRALFAGATATLVLAIALAVAGILAWETFFTQVHALFFADGTWTFRLDDTLIRLFPAQFWIDAAAAVGAIVLIGSVLTLVLTWPTKARREKSARAYEPRRRANSSI